MVDNTRRDNVTSQWPVERLIASAMLAASGLPTSDDRAALVEFLSQAKAKAGDIIDNMPEEQQAVGGDANVASDTPQAQQPDPDFLRKRRKGVI